MSPFMSFCFYDMAEQPARLYSARCVQSILKDSLRCYRLWPLTTKTSHVMLFLEDVRNMLNSFLKTTLGDMNGLKFWLCLCVEFCRSTDESDKKMSYFPNSTTTILNETEIPDKVTSSYEEVVKEVDSFEQNGSDWVVFEIKFIDLHCAKYSPLRGSTSSKLPPSIQIKHAIINPDNEDQKCFLWSVLIGIYPKQSHRHRISQYRCHENAMDMTGISYPVAIDEIARFTEQNRISVNVFTFDENLSPLRMAGKRLKKHVNLFYYDGHYSYIRNMDRLLGDQNRHKAKGHYCDMCLFAFNDFQKLEGHRSRCTPSYQSLLKMPDKESCTLKFSNLHKSLRKPFVLFADFECILEPTNITTNNPPNLSWTHKKQRHVPCSFGFVVSKSCCNAPEFSNLTIYTGVDAVQKFLETVVKFSIDHVDEINKYPMFTPALENEMDFLQTELCHICSKPLESDRVRDHCHFCGKFRGAAHNSCNQQLRLNREFVIIFHNLRRYDGHLLMSEMGVICEKYQLELNCIAKGMEDYVTFSLRKRGQNGWCIRFIDSCQFLAASLDELVKTLEPTQFKALNHFFTDPKESSLLLRKGVMPYDYISSFEILKQTEPVAKEHFFNNLTGEHLSDSDYEHFRAVWSALGVQNLQEYLELYLTTDVLLLADVFEVFRSSGLQSFKLDPCHFATLPGLAWDACLKTTQVELELLSDPEMYMFMEKGIRGGISMISKRRANVSDHEKSAILYLDANNLYGWSMLQKLPQSDFRWMSDEEISNFSVSKITCDDEIGYVLEVDLEYPEHLHDGHNCYPLAPETFEITPEMLSPYSKAILHASGTTPKSTTKLVPNLYHKKNYIVHGRNLQYYLRLGLTVNKIHRVLMFKQSAWMEKYINFNTEKRKSAKTELERSIHKLYNNAVFGKTMENVRKYVDVRFVTNPKQFKKLVKKPNFVRAIIFSCDLVAVVLLRTTIALNKPIYAGFAVLELSKLLMYEFHYDYIKQKYGEEAELLMTDTDSLMYHIKTNDVYEDMRQDLDRFDTSNYLPDNPLHSTKNKKVVGKMKDETKGKPITDFVGLRAKMYSFVCSGDEKKRAKGVKRKVVENNIRHDDYVNVLETAGQMYHTMNFIRSFQHELYSTTINKKSIGAYDDKRYILDDGVNSLAHGHFKIQKLSFETSSSSGN
ncbi:MAG: endonuclease domain-containing protein [Cyanophyceae cyanobacterium]